MAGVGRALEDTGLELDLEVIPKFNNDVLVSEFQMLLGVGLTWPAVPSSWTGAAGESVRPD